MEFSWKPDLWLVTIPLAFTMTGVLSMALGTGSLDLAWAQEPSTGRQESESALPAEQDQDMPAEGKPEPGTQPEKPRILPPRLRPKVLTTEEHAEAERLKQLGAMFGTDPTAIVGRVQLSSQYVALSNDARLSDSTLRVDLPYRNNWLLRVDLPFLRWIDPNRMGTTSAEGMSDLAAVAAWRAYNTPEYAVLIGVISTFPTGSDNTLSTGKYNVGPILATARFLPRWQSFLFGVFQHLTSVGGDPARKDIEQTQATLQVNTIWNQRTWTTVQGVLRIDWERHARSGMTLEFEAGRNVIGRWGVYGRPGVGLWGRDVGGGYLWNFEVGIRYIFPSF